MTSLKQHHGKGKFIYFFRSFKNEYQTLSHFVVFDIKYNALFWGKSLELPFRNNNIRVSCIPLGHYNGIKSVSARNGNVLNILNVVGRTNIQVHKGNFYNNSTGCILVGEEYAYINGDANLDITHSKYTMNELFLVMAGSFDVYIMDLPTPIKTDFI